MNRKKGDARKEDRLKFMAGKSVAVQTETDILEEKGRVEDRCSAEDNTGAGVRNIQTRYTCRLFKCHSADDEDENFLGDNAKLVHKQSATFERKGGGNRNEPGYFFRDGEEIYGNSSFSCLLGFEIRSRVFTSKG